MDCIVQGCNGEFVGRIEGGLRRNELPRAYAGVCSSKWNGGKEPEHN
jgi:hypothetical protein